MINRLVLLICDLMNKRPLFVCASVVKQKAQPGPKPGTVSRPVGVGLAYQHTRMLHFTKATVCSLQKELTFVEGQQCVCEWSHGEVMALFHCLHENWKLVPGNKKTVTSKVLDGGFNLH